MSLLEIAGRRIRGDFTVDAFGLDREIHDAAVRLGRIRWNVVVAGAEHIPGHGPALLVVQRRVGLSEQAVVAVGIATSTDRRVHSAGFPGVKLAEAPLRRIGAALSHPDETSALLRDGAVVSVGLGWSPVRDEVGPLAASVLSAPLVLGAPVLPVAVRGREWGRTWRVLIGEPVVLEGHDAQTVEEAAALVRSRVQRLARVLRST
jgi:hypothetical protein